MNAFTVVPDTLCVIESGTWSQLINSSEQSREAVQFGGGGGVGAGADCHIVAPAGVIIENLELSTRRKAPGWPEVLVLQT
jgi:hypothetical protein